jgi:cytochrome c oxidase subunit 3
MAEHTSETRDDGHAGGSSPPPGGGHAEHDHGHGHGHHYPNLAHHFDTPQQQFDAGKLGIWLFLLTEVLFFSGLFCAYTVYRGMHPEVFVYAHYFLNTTMGAINTCVLLVSSLTAAWAVRNAQLAQRKLLVLNIAITIVCACTFMVVKFFEYEHKFHDGLLPGPAFHPTEQVWELESFKHKHPEAAEYAEKLTRAAEAKEHGFVDVVTTADKKAKNTWNLAAFGNAPAALKEPPPDKGAEELPKEPAAAGFFMAAANANRLRLLQIA